MTRLTPGVLRSSILSTLLKLVSFNHLDTSSYEYELAPKVTRKVRLKNFEKDFVVGPDALLPANASRMMTCPPGFSDCATLCNNAIFSSEECACIMLNNKA